MTKPKFIAIDTEFLRERTYFPKLCLVQIAAPEGDPIILDPLEGDDLTDLEEALFDPDVVKVFHAGRQDLEIFYHLYGKVPAPLFDTQVAAMALGYGDSVSYAGLVADVCKHSIDKAQQFTNWSLRPLTAEQLAYAGDDVLYLREVYTNFRERLDKEGRNSWIEEEMANLSNPDIYATDPEEAYQRIKIRSDKRPVMSVLKALAAWREREAIRKDIPRGRVFKDETLAEIALTQPRSSNALSRVRGFPNDLAGKDLGQTILTLVEDGLSIAKDDMPQIKKSRPFPQDLRPVLEMLKMLLRIQASDTGISARLIANADDLQELALDGDKANVPALSSWRREVFGDLALQLMTGQLSLSVKEGKITKTQS